VRDIGCILEAAALTVDGQILSNELMVNLGMVNRV